MIEKTMTDLILKILVDENDLRDLPIERLQALAEKIGRCLSGAEYKEKVKRNLGDKNSAHVLAAERLENEAYEEANRGHTKRALELMMKSVDEQLCIE